MHVSILQPYIGETEYVKLNAVMHHDEFDCKPSCKPQAGPLASWRRRRLREYSLKRPFDNAPSFLPEGPLPRHPLLHRMHTCFQGATQATDV